MTYSKNRDNVQLYIICNRLLGFFYRVLTCSRLVLKPEAGGSLVWKSSFLFLCVGRVLGAAALITAVRSSRAALVPAQTSPADICCSLPGPGSLSQRALQQN